MKEKWLMACNGSWEDLKPHITTALESGFDCILVERAHMPLVRELGGIKVACFGTVRGDEDVMVIGRRSKGELDLPDDLSASAEIGLARTVVGPKAGYVEIRSKRDEEFAVELGRFVDYLLVVSRDWVIIPLENMIAGLQGSPVKIISGVKGVRDAEVALSTLEHGADGILLDAADPSEIKKVQDVADRLEIANLKLVPATVTSVRPVGMADRVCVDTTSLMQPGEGMLVGSQSRGFFLVQSEAEDSPYVASRPFRVNAGAVHAYIRVGEATRYLSELKSGDEVTVVARDGTTRKALVGRVKIERRPMMLLEAEVEGDRISTLLQNAETIKLVTPEGPAQAVTDLYEGDQVLVYLEGGGRHFGMSIEETIIER